MGREHDTHQLLELLSEHCNVNTLSRLTASSKQFASQLQGLLVQQQLVRLLPEALCNPSAASTPQQSACTAPSLSDANPMVWLCKAVGSTFIKAHAAEIGSACLQAKEVWEPAARRLVASGLELGYSQVLAAAVSSARQCTDNQGDSAAAALIRAGAVQDAPVVAQSVCHRVVFGPDDVSIRLAAVAACFCCRPSHRCLKET
jgi:hypothetical protein